MLGRRRLIAIAMALGALWLVSCPTAYAQDSFQRFFPFLIDLAGWTGAKPDGVAMEIPGSTMISASREYQRGEAKLTAQVLIGPLAQGVIATAQSGMKIETPDERMSTSTIDGLQVMQTFTISDKSGAILVALGTSAVFLLAFNGIGDDEALALARRFDWKAMQAALPK